MRESATTCEYYLLHLRALENLSLSTTVICHSLKMIQGLRGYLVYETFAYQVATLRQLIKTKEAQKQRRQAGLDIGDKLNMSVHGSSVLSKKKGFGPDGSGSKGNKFASELDGSCKF